MKKSTVFKAIAFISIFTACSSAPKRPMIDSTIYNSTTTFLENANANILKGDYEKADFLLNEAHKNAMSIDNYDLLTSVTLARVSLYLSFDPPAIEKAQESLEKAYSYAKFSDFSEKQTALCVLSEVRIATSNEQTADFSNLLTKLDQNQSAVKGDPYNEAHFLTAKGDIYKLQKNYKNAEEAYSAAAKSFTDNRYLSEIGISWYKAAQARSLDGNKQGALQALDNAIYYDRLAENSLALGTDYYAKAIVLLKGSPSQKEKDEAAYSFEHSAEIFEAAGFTDLAEKSRNQ